MGRGSALLRVDRLTVEYASPRSSAPIRALDALSFELAAGERLGILGESGCGKTTLALSLMRLLPPSGRLEGAVSFGEQRLDRLAPRQLRQVRGAQLALIPQNPARSLHPMKRIGGQFVDALRAHRAWSIGRCRQETLQRLDAVGLERAAELVRAYPHQLSGGQQQRLAVALALACEPSLVIADEPTSALDAHHAGLVLELLERLSRDAALGWILISHDPRVLVRIVDRVLVLYAGRLVEDGPAQRVLERPAHPYTRALLRSLPPPPPTGPATSRPPLPVIDGESVIAHGPATRCRFAPRCPRSTARCEQEVPIAESFDGRRVWCWHPGEEDG